MRLKLLKRTVSLAFLFLILSLAYNQIIKGEHYFRLSQNNRIKLVRLSAPRGLIYDRQGEILAGQRLMFNVAVLAQEVKDVQGILEDLSPVLNIPQQELMHQFKRNFSAPFSPAVVARDIPKETAILLECKECDIPGLIIQAEPLRDYRYGESLCHILGYLGRVGEEELKEFKLYGLNGLEDLVGRSGVEEKFDRYLRGQPGGMQVEVNNRGYKVRALSLRQAQAGEDLNLTIDVQIQQLVDGLLEGEKGACIVMRAESGEILAMVSRPGFDSNLFIAALNGKPAAAEKIEELLNSQEGVLLNRAISGAYAPGSIFKIIVAAAGLETGKITPEAKLFCPGSLLVGNREFFCWNLSGHGSENIYSAITHSCNVYFYKLALKVGPDQLSAFAHKFGLGRCTNIDLPYEAGGLVPSKSWKLKAKKERWYDGETANFAIGQGYLLVTPLQTARVIAAVANGGYLVQPHIVKRNAATASPDWREKITLKPETLEVIKEGMRGVIQDAEGSGHRAYLAGIQWAGKTGTAQTSSEVPHGWFGGFYPFEQPRIVVLVFLEYGGSGGERPALIAREIIKYIVEKKL